MSKKNLSVFVDESGDFGSYELHAPFYIVSMVLHNQQIDIARNISDFEAHMRNMGYGQHAIHTDPLIRRESIYVNDPIESRKCLFNALFHFFRNLDIKYACVKIKKVEYSDVIALTAKISKEIANIIRSYESFQNDLSRT